MGWVMNMRTGTKIFLSFGIILLIQIAIIAISYRNMVSLRESQEKLYNVQFVAVENFMTLVNYQSENRVDILSMLLSKSRTEQEQWKKDILGRESKAQEILKKLLNYPKDSIEITMKIDSLNKMHNEYSKILLNQAIPLILDSQLDKARVIAIETLEDPFNKMMAMANELVDTMESIADTLIANSALLVNKSIRTLLLFGLASVIFSVVVVVLMSRMITKPLNNISSVSKRIAKGDLSHDITKIERTDEFGILSESFQDMILNLRKLTMEITESVNFLGSSASEISTTTGELAASSSQIATAVSETTTTIEEIKQTAQVASQKAKAVSESSEKSAEISETGKKAANEIRDMIGRIQSQMKLIAESMIRLNEQSQAIGTIIATVDDLSQQSNLLSVNASIEAAKAGEQGKGFSVVAQEVKSLAVQSKQATSQVRAILNDIQKATSAAVMATEQGGKSVEEGVKKCTQTSESILKLVNNVTGASQAATQIAASSHQQLIGMEQAAVAMENIKQASAQNVESTKQLKLAANTLKDMGDKLKKLVGRYKLSKKSGQADTSLVSDV